VYRLVLIAVAITRESRAFHERAQVVERDPAVDLNQSAFNDVLELG